MFIISFLARPYCVILELRLSTVLEDFVTLGGGWDEGELEPHILYMWKLKFRQAGPPRRKGHKTGFPDTQSQALFYIPISVFSYHTRHLHLHSFLTLEHLFKKIGGVHSAAIAGSSTCILDPIPFGYSGTLLPHSVVRSQASCYLICQHSTGFLASTPLSRLSS